MPPDVFKDAYGSFVICMHKDWQVTSLGRNTLGYDEDKSFNIYNDGTQKVIVHYDMI